MADPVSPYQPIANYFGGTLGATFGERENVGGVPLVEHGVDVSLPAGTLVKLPAGGTYRPELSTRLQQVFQEPSGVYESITHADILGGIQGGYFYPGGTNVVSVDPTGAGSSGGVTYYSTGPHIELGFAQAPGGITAPGQFFNSAYAIDPLVALGGGPSSYTTATRLSPTIGALDGGGSTIGSDLGAIAKGSATFLIAGVVVLILANTPLHPLAWGILIVAIVFALLAKNGVALISDTLGRFGITKPFQFGGK